MKEFRFKWLVLAFAVCLVFGLSSPVSAAGGNGFLSGDHYNLNLIGKKSDLNAGGYFPCPSPESYQFAWWKDADSVDDGSCVVDNGVANEWCTSCDRDKEVGCIQGAAKERNVIFVPRDNDTDGIPGPDRDISMLMTSGASGSAKGGRQKNLTGEQAWCTTAGGCLEVTDWCTQHFPDNGTKPTSLSEAAGGDGAAFTLPASNTGYRVFARVMGRPVEGDAFQFLKPTIADLRDEFGNTLFDDEGYSYLDFGTINPDGSCIDANNVPNPDCILQRSDNGPGTKGKKGVQKATELSALFQFTGDICYVNDTSCQYCYQIVGSGNELDNGQFCNPGDPGTWLGGTACSYTCNTPFSNANYAGADLNDPNFVCCFANNQNPNPYVDESDPNIDPYYWVDKDGKLCDPYTAPTNMQCVRADANDSCGEPANYDCRIDALAYTDQYVCSGDEATVCTGSGDIATTTLECGGNCSVTTATQCNTSENCPTGETCVTTQTCVFDKLICAAGNEITPECRHYDDIWVFNVADFVNVLMEMKTGGAYIVQLRFYPVQ